MNANDIIDQTLTDEQINRYEDIARRDDWHRILVGSEIRLLIGDLKRARAAVRVLKSSLPADSEVELAAQDAAHGGTAFMQDGKRIDPVEVYSLPAETVSDAMVEDLVQTAIEAFDNVYDVEFRTTGIIDNKPVAMRAALEAAALAHTDDGWRPIENAPREGTGILVWIKGARLPFTSKWSVTRNRWVDLQSDESVRPSPTHWRPLPAPPKDGRE